MFSLSLTLFILGIYNFTKICVFQAAQLFMCVHNLETHVWELSYIITFVLKFGIAVLVFPYYRTLPMPFFLP